MADIFSIIADPTRRQILSVLRDCADQSGSDASTSHPGELSVSELVSRLELSQPTVSKHLKVLRDSGLVEVRDEGQHRYYRANPSALAEVRDWVQPFLVTAEVETAQGTVVDLSSELVASTLTKADSLFRESSELGKKVGRRIASLLVGRES